MEQGKNYAKELDKIIDRLEEADKENEEPLPKDFLKAPLPGRKLLLHSCCAPCSSYVLEYLREYFDITVFYYNPNITEDGEYRKRVEEQKRLIAEYNRQAEEGCLAGMHSTEKARRIEVIEGDYESDCFYMAAKGLEKCPEGGERCFRCYELRLRKTAELAAEKKFDCFTTTLTISPLKNARKLNEIGEKLGREYGVFFLPSDFKKKNGYQRSIELSAKFGLYRQDYCGCIYSKREREERKER